MSTTPQSARPSTFMPFFRTKVAQALGINDTFVRIVTEPTDDKWPVWATEPLAACLRLGPIKARPDSGAGRYAYFIDRELQVTIWIRSGLDVSGDEVQGLTLVWDYEDTLIDQFLLKLPNELIPAGVQFHKPIKLVEDSGAERLMKVDAGKYRITLSFALQYSAPVTV